MPEITGNSVSSDSGCTTGCTSEGKNEQIDPVAALADKLMSLSEEDRKRLAAMLAGQGQGDEGCTRETAKRTTRTVDRMDTMDTLPPQRGAEVRDG